MQARTGFDESLVILDFIQTKKEPVSGSQTRLASQAGNGRSLLPPRILSIPSVQRIIGVPLKKISGFREDYTQEFAALSMRWLNDFSNKSKRSARIKKEPFQALQENPFIDYQRSIAPTSHCPLLFIPVATSVPSFLTPTV